MNRHIVISGAIITGIGVLNAVAKKQKLSPVVQGSIIFVSLLSILEAIDPGNLGKIASALAVLASVVSLMIELPSIVTALGIGGK